MIVGGIGDGFRGIVIGMFAGILLMGMAHLMSYAEHPKGLPLRGYVRHATVAYSKDSRGNVSMHITVDRIKPDHYDRFTGEVELHIVKQRES